MKMSEVAILLPARFTRFGMSRPSPKLHNTTYEPKFTWNYMAKKEKITIEIRQKYFMQFMHHINYLPKTNIIVLP